MGLIQYPTHQPDGEHAKTMSFRRGRRIHAWPGEKALHCGAMAGQYGGRQRVAAAGLGGIEGALAEDGFAAGHFRRGDGHSRELGLFQGHA